MPQGHIRSNGIRLHVVQAGAGDGPVVILLHGFPEFWRGWHRQIPALAEAGFRVIVPDQRGYNLSDKPRGITGYGVTALTADILGLMDALGCAKVRLVGHDWGAAVAWATALWHPERVEKLAILNVPHPAVMLSALRHNPAQMRKSWYIGFFQLPWLPEALLRADNWRRLVGMMLRTSRDGVFTPEDIELYRQAWSRPGAMTAMINWYRALLHARPPLPPLIRIRVPALMLWGVRDVALGSEMAQPSIDLCDEGRLVLFENAGHWLQHEDAGEVNRLLIEFLGERPA